MCVCVFVPLYPHRALIQGVPPTSLGHGRAVASPDGHLMQCPAGDVSCISHSLLDVVSRPQAQLPELREGGRHLTYLPATQQVTQGHAAGGEGRGGEGRGGEGRGGEGRGGEGRGGEGRGGEGRGGEGRGGEGREGEGRGGDERVVFSKSVTHT